MILIDRIGSLPNVSLCTGCTLSELEGDEAGLTQVRVRHEASGDEEVVATRHLFLYRRGPENRLGSRRAASNSTIAASS